MIERLRRPWPDHRAERTLGAVSLLVCVLVIKHYEQSLGEASKWLLLPISIVLFVGAAWLTLRMPRRLSTFGTIL